MSKQFRGNHDQTLFDLFKMLPKNANGQWYNGNNCATRVDLPPALCQKPGSINICCYFAFYSENLFHNIINNKKVLQSF